MNFLSDGNNFVILIIAIWLTYEKIIRYEQMGRNEVPDLFVLMYDCSFLW